MPKFHYSGVSFQGQPVKGELAARDEAELKSLLQADGVIVSHAQRGRSDSPRLGQLVTRRHRELAPFTRQMATMLSAGVRVDRVLAVLVRQAHSQRWRTVIAELGERVKAGSSLSDALEVRADIFDCLYVSLVRAGESSGELPLVLERLALYLENSEKIGRKVKAAFLYPLAVLIVSILVVLVLLIYIIPLFSEMFVNFHAELPAMTKTVISVSDFVRQEVVVITPLLALIGLVGWRATKSAYFRSRLGAFVIRLPIVGNLIVKSQLAHFCRTCETLLEGGVLLPEAISLASATARNLRLRTELRHGIDELRRGRPLHAAWEGSSVVPPIAAEMVQVGEETGELPQMFDKLAQVFGDEVDTIAPALTAILEPLLIVIVGVLVAGILISMYLPLFELISQLG